VLTEVVSIGGRIGPDVGAGETALGAVQRSRTEAAASAHVALPPHADLRRVERGGQEQLEVPVVEGTVAVVCMITSRARRRGVSQLT